MVNNQRIRKETKPSKLHRLCRSLRLKTISTMVLAMTLAAVSFAQAPDKAKLDEFFDKLDQNHKAMGSLLITKDGNTLYTRTIGYSQVNGNEKTALTSATRFRVGSVTKMFTAALIFQLAEEGKLKLEDKLDRYFPQVPNAQNITITHILAHRSGIHDISEDADFRSRRLEGLTKEALLALMIKSKPDFEAGAKYAYSNTGYQLLGMLVEKLTGKPYQQVLKERITSKIALKDTYMGTATINVAQNESFSYRYGRDWEVQPDTHASLLFGSGAMVSTTADMARFIQALFDGKIVSKTSLEQMKKDSLGMTTFTYNGKTFYGHTGGIDNFGAWLVYQPEERLAVSYGTNAKVYPVTNIIDGVFALYYQTPFTIPTFESMAISTAILDQYAGIYSSSEAPVTFTFTRDGNKLYVQMPNQSVVPLEPTAIDLFKIESAPVAFRFNAAKKEMTVIRSGRERVFTKQ